jgi:type II secretory pathway pseudopilin PulG
VLRQTRYNPESGTAKMISARTTGRWGFTLVEAAVSIVLVGMMLVAALNAVGAARTTEKRVADRSRALWLAEDLMSEILRQHYEEPNLPVGSFGLAGSEVGDGSRALWDDVDDYHNWSASPPQQKDGTELAGFADCGRSVDVDWVEAVDFSQTSGSDTGIKQITVTVTYKQVPVLSLVAIRTNALDYVPESE